MAIQKCPICNKKYDNINSLVRHIEKKHNDQIPENWSGGKYLFYLKHGRTTGKCIICGKETTFNESTMKPNRLCGDPECVQTMRENAKKNMLKKYGKETLLNDPEFQKKMLMHRKISKEYIWSDGSKKLTVGSYEYDAARFLDIFMGFESKDVIMPASVVIYYQYKGETKFYIPDIYIPSLNLIIEIKDGGNNPNMHHKIQEVDKVKEKLKENAIRNQKKYNYVKIENKEYGIFIETLLKLKGIEIDNNSKNSKHVIMTKENVENIQESIKNKDKILLQLDNIINENYSMISNKELNEINFPIKGLKIQVNNKYDFYLLKEKLIRGDIPEIYKDRVESFIIENNLKYNLKDNTCLIDENAKNNLMRDLNTINYKEKYIVKLLENCINNDELSIVKYELNNVKLEDDKLLLENAYNIKSNKLEHININKDNKNILKAIRENNINYLNSLNTENLKQAVKFLCLYELAGIKTNINIDNEILHEIGMDLKPSIQLSLDPDGNILIKRHENVDFMTIYSNSHTLLKEYEKVKNIESIKYELCKLFYMKTLLDNNYIYNKKKIFKSKEKQQIEKNQALKTKAFIMNDFKYYLRFVLSYDNTFNFNEYFSKTQFGIEIYKLDNRLFKLLSSIKKIIL